jgi:hypothetical protein
MAQKTNLNVSPYFDDFSEGDIGARDNNYYKVLFNPGRAIQTRELNTLQSILQDQIESFGSHIFQEGSVVIPGNIGFDNQFNAVRLSPTQYGINILSYIEQYVGKTIIGQTSGISASVQYVQLPNNNEVQDVTLYVKYINSDNDFNINAFSDNELLYSEESISYDDNTSIITAGTPFASTVPSDATKIGAAVSIGDGVYFIRGTFVKIKSQTKILSYYDNKPSCRVGLQINEEIVTAKDDQYLYDNARGFTNYAAPGADRLKISLTLTSKSITDFNDIDFVELLRIEDGNIKKIESKTSYSLIRDYIAQRTYEESGNYVVNPFTFLVTNSLNDRLGNDGAFFPTEKTNQGNVPAENLMCIKFSPGKAYVRGYDIEKTGIEIIDVPKPRTKQFVENQSVPFDMGNLVIVNNVSGSPKQKEIVYLQNRRKNGNTVGAGSTIGSARVYSFSLTDAAYNGASTNWDLYLYDIQTYTELTLNQPVSSIELPATSFIKGKSSGASGYAVNAGLGTSRISIRQTSGVFINGEQILINGADFHPRTISSVKTFGINDVKSIHQPAAVTGFSTAFISDTQLDNLLRSDVITISASSGGISTATVSSPNTLAGITSENIIKYQRTGASAEIYNRVVSIAPSKTSMILETVPSVSGVCDGTLPSSQTSVLFSLGITLVKNDQRGFLYSEIPDSNVASVNLSNSTLTFSAQSNTTFTPSGNSLTVNLGNFNLGLNTSFVVFTPFDEERYSIFYSDGTVENLTSDKVTLNSNSRNVTFSNIANKQIASINATFVKTGIQSKEKQFVRSKTLDLYFSRNRESGTGISTSIGDGLTYNAYYGLRVQDEEISLNYPDVVKVISVYESLDSSAPSLDTLSFSSIVNVDVNAIIGENIIGDASNTVARVVSKPSSNTLGVVYLNNNRFNVGETVTFEESGINTPISSISLGRYRDITRKFDLDKGQKDQYYDYSKLIRKFGETAPSKRLLVVFDYYSVPSNDNGDVFSVNSYSEQRFSSDIPNIGPNNVRASDTLDFRPRVLPFAGISSSPFDFSSRYFGTDPKIIMTPNENAIIGYSFYLGRIDKLYLDKFGTFGVQQGIPSVEPRQPNIPDTVMEIATLVVPPYLYNPRDIQITMVDNRRYTMRDIGRLEDKVENLERVTSLSLLELNTQTLQIRDAQGLDRFKTGFFVDDFKNNSLINNALSSVEIDTDRNELRPIRSQNSLSLRLTPLEAISDQIIDSRVDYTLFDSNVQKKDDAVLLKYDSVEWIKQTFATKVENVNPFNIISYVGSITLHPQVDNWVRTIRLQDILVTTWAFGWGGVFTQDSTILSGQELYMRSRNTEFTAVNLKPFTRYYQFLDGNSGIDLIPKLVEIATDSTLQTYGASKAFIVGEEVVGSIISSSGQSTRVISFRIAVSNHKLGGYNDPEVRYTTNPYVPTETIPDSYSSSSKILNVDVESLACLKQGLFNGYLTIGMRLVGQTSGAVAYVKDLRLISDVNGFLSGSFYIRDPHTTPPPSVRIQTGSKVYKLTSSSTNEVPLPGNTTISSAEAVYKAEGSWEQRQRTITTVIAVPPPPPVFSDPLAQSFTVGGLDIESLSSSGGTPNDDKEGAFLTALDLFFANKDTGNATLTVDIRTMELGTPTRVVLGDPVILRPEDIKTSRDASVPTRVTFDYPIYLAPDLEYAIVLTAAQSNKYEVWIAEMGEKTIETSTLPDSQSVRYGTQFAIGSLFKSQNGSIWTANQYQDLKFKLYKARFSTRTGSVYFDNPTLHQSNGYVPTLQSNPINILPRQIKIGITTTTNTTNIGILTTGRKVSVQSNQDVYGYIVGTGSSVSTVGIMTGGVNYSPTSNVGTYSISGRGTGLRLNITNVSTGTSAISALTVANPGNGYTIGDVVGIVTSDISPSSGRDAIITITNISGVDTLYLSNVQGESFAVGVSTLVYYDTSNNPQTISGINVTSSTPVGGVYSGNYFKVNHFNHGMHSNLNKLKIENAESDVSPTSLSSPLSSADTTISVASTTNFNSFEGIPVSAINPGYALVENEIIKYVSLGEGTLTGITRGIDSTLVLSYPSQSLVYKYELGGVSLRRINKEHNISSNGDNDIDSHYVEFDRTNFDSNATNRSLDQGSGGTPANSPLLSFNSEIACGGNTLTTTENIQYDTIVPYVSVLTPGSSTSYSGQIRTVSGTSVDGTENSFVDQEYEPIQFNVENKLSSTRLICSQVNANNYLGFMPNKKSLILKIDLATTNPNLSPMVNWQRSAVNLIGNRINSPVGDYITDNRVNSFTDDPHATVYISNTVNLVNPSSSLRVILSAYRPANSDFRVLYSLIRPDSSEVTQSFELFPGYDNLTIDMNQDGYLDVVDPSRNSGLPDVRVPASLENQFLEYEYTASNLGSFTGYTIKIVMSSRDQSRVPIFKDLRSIAIV